MLEIGPAYFHRDGVDLARMGEGGMGGGHLDTHPPLSLSKQPAQCILGNTSDKCIYLLAPSES